MERGGGKHDAARNFWFYAASQVCTSNELTRSAGNSISQALTEAPEKGARRSKGKATKGKEEKYGPGGTKDDNERKARSLPPMAATHGWRCG